jgi:CubicO group peptidase (beta-lactamase class C family)
MQKKTFILREKSSLDKKTDALAENTLKEWDIPGIALSIVQENNIIKTEGYGVKQRGTFNKVDSETVFQICSLTKAFSTYMINILAEKGQLKWEEPIITYLPSFLLKDSIATSQMTLRDLLSHRTGLPGTSKECWRLWWHTKRTTDDLLNRLKFVDPAYPFRSHSTYNNMAYVLASQIASEVSGSKWEDLCEKHIFKSLGMKRTNFSYKFLLDDKNVASPHLIPDLKKDPIMWDNWESVKATGGINSCAKDMAIWMTHLLKSPNFRAIANPQSLFEFEGLLDELSMPSSKIFSHNQNIINYGLGWMIYTLNNYEI